MYFLKVLSRKTNITINLERVATTFEAKLSGCTPPELSYCATLLLRRKLVLDAMVPPRCFKQTGAVLKAATLAALSKFCENTALVLEFLGGFVESQRNRKPPGFLTLGDDEPLLTETAGSAAAMFLAGPSLMCAELRRGAGWIIASDGTARALPRHGHGGFASGCAH
jgi:hypothetical protein